MAQNLTIAGASYSDVPSVTFNKTGGGTASFVDTSDANAAAGNVLSGKTAYVNGSKITGTISSKAAATYTPTTSNQTIAAGQYLSGAQTVKGDANLVAGNIKKGVTVFGVTGTYGGNQTVTINAPKNSTLTWSGTASGSASMGSLTQATISLAVGTYTFTNTLTVEGTSITLFTKTVAITSATTVNMYPAGAIYWYGIKVLPLATYYTSPTESDKFRITGWQIKRTSTAECNIDNVPVDYDNYMYQHPSSYNNRTGGIATSSSINLANYSTLHMTGVRGTAASRLSGYVFADDDRSFVINDSTTYIARSDDLATTGLQTVNASVASSSANAYFCFGLFFKSANTGQIDFKVYAVWVD